jgi:predicted dehydrogenase
MSNLNLAIIGYGNMGKVHSKSLKKNYLCNEPIIIDSNPDIKKEISGLDYFKSVQSIPDEKFKNLDGAIISSPSSNHLEQAKLFINQGIPVLVEKPLTDNLQDSLELITLAKKNNVLMKCGLIELHNPVVEEISNIKFEKIHFVQFKRHSPKTVPSRKLENIVLDLTVHDISILLKVFKPEKIDIIGCELIYENEIAESVQVLLKVDDSFTIFLSSSRQDQEKIRTLEIVDNKSSYYCDLKNKLYEIKRSGISSIDSKNITETNLLDKIDMLDKPETADIQLETFLTSIKNKQVDNVHLDLVERTHLLAYEILGS